MKLAEWLEHRAGLKGKKLEGAVKMCEDNWIETLGELRVLALDEKLFEKTFPQTMMRSILQTALKEDPNNEEPDNDDEKVSRQGEAQTKEEASNR